jgi:hypothetical protein
MEKPTPALTETPLQGESFGSHRDAATGQAGLLPISQTPCGDLDNLLRKPSNFLGIVDKDAVGAIFLLDKCREDSGCGFHGA